MKRIYVFGNGNISWERFHQFYIEPLQGIALSDCEFFIGDFSGTDTLMMEFLKDKTEKVTVLHIGQKPRYTVNTFNTRAASWNIKGGFSSDRERDQFAIDRCTHYLAADFNSDEKRISGTQKNMEQCFALQKIKL